MTTRAEAGFWTPTNEATQSIGAVLRAHWAEAKKVAATSPFFRRSANWLEVSRNTLARATSHAVPVMAPRQDPIGFKGRA